MVRVTETTDTTRFPLPHVGVDYARVAAPSDRPEFMVSGVRLNYPVVGQRMQSGGSAPSYSKLSPVNGATTQPSALTLTWEPLAGGTYTYAVCVDTTNNNACDTTWQSAGLATSLGVSGLANGTYYWQVRATDGATTRFANYENWWAFSVGAAAPALFNKLSPSNGMTGLASTVTLTWSAAAGATEYQVCVDTVKDDSCTTSWVTAGLNTLVRRHGAARRNALLAGREPCSARPAGCLADNGAEFGFTVGGTPPATFTKASPANAATGLGSSVTATWNAMAGATEYQGCIDTVNDGNCNTSWQTAGASTSWGLTNLAAGTYYWQVRANVSGSWVLADNGAAWSFTVGGTTPPPVFGKLTPANGTTGLGSSVTLQWSTLTDAGYSVCWDTTNNNTCDGAWWPNGGGNARTLDRAGQRDVLLAGARADRQRDLRGRRRHVVVVHGRALGPRVLQQAVAGEWRIGPGQFDDADVGRVDGRELLRGVRGHDQQQRLRHDVADGGATATPHAERPGERAVLLAGAGAERAARRTPMAATWWRFRVGPARRRSRSRRRPTARRGWAAR